MPDEDERDSESERRKRLVERVIPVIVKRMVERAVESGVERLQDTPENLRNFVGDLKLPKDVIGDIYGQIDDTKNGLYRVVAKEIRDVLEQTRFADEIVNALTKLSFEIKTEIRFIPNQANEGARSQFPPASEETPEGASERGRPASVFPKPQVKAEVTVRDHGKKKRGEDE